MQKEELHHFDKTFEKVDYSDKQIYSREFENCTFINCDFSKSRFIESIFTDCIFSNCNLSMTKFAETAIKDVKFENSKLTGVDFSECNKFMFSANFYTCLMNTIFKKCKIEESNFLDLDLSQSVFDDCDLNLSIFDNCDLTKTDFTNSHNITLDPEKNKFKRTKFSSTGALGLLNKYDIEII